MQRGGHQGGSAASPQEWLETATRWFLNFEELAGSDTLQALTRTYLNDDAKAAGLWKQPDFLRGAAEMLQLGFKTMWLRLCERTRKTKLKREKWVKRLRSKRTKRNTKATD